MEAFRRGFALTVVPPTTIALYLGFPLAAPESAFSALRTGVFSFHRITHEVTATDYRTEKRWQLHRSM